MSPADVRRLKVLLDTVYGNLVALDEVRSLSRGTEDAVART